MTDHARWSAPDGDRLLVDLYHDYWNSLLGYIKTLMFDHHLAEDVAQETFLRAWRHRD